MLGLEEARQPDEKSLPGDYYYGAKDTIRRVLSTKK